MIVHQDQRRSLELERALDHLAGIDRGVVDRPALLLLVLDQRILAVEEEDVKPLDLAMRDVRGAIINELVPRADHRPPIEFRPHQPKCRLAHRLDVAARVAGEEDHLDELVIGQIVRPSRD